MQSALLAAPLLVTLSSYLTLNTIIAQCLHITLLFNFTPLQQGNSLNGIDNTTVRNRDLEQAVQIRIFGAFAHLFLLLQYIVGLLPVIFWGLRNNWYQSYNCTIIEIGAQRPQSCPIAWPSTGSEQGFPCEVFPHKEKPFFTTGNPFSYYRDFSVRKTSQGNPCFHYREEFAEYIYLLLLLQLFPISFCHQNLFLNLNATLKQGDSN